MMNDKISFTKAGRLRCSRLILLALFCLMESAWTHEVQFGQTTVRVAGVEEAQWDLLKSMLMDQLTLNGSGPAGEPLADDLAFFVRQHFIREGWPNAEASWKMVKVGIDLTVKPGNAVRVGAVTLKGEMPLPEEELKKYLMKPTLSVRMWIKSSLNGWRRTCSRAQGWCSGVCVPKVT